MTGITLSTRVGRLSETHSDIGIQLTQFPSQKGMRETQGGRVSATELLNKLFTHLQNAAERRRLKAAEGNVLGSIVETTMNQIESGKPWSTVEGAGTQG